MFDHRWTGRTPMPRFTSSKTTAHIGTTNRKRGGHRRLNGLRLLLSAGRRGNLRAYKRRSFVRGKGGVLFFFRVSKADRARLSALKIRFSSSEFSARSCFLYSSTVKQPDSDLSATRMCFWRSNSNFSPSSSSDLTFSTCDFCAADLALSRFSPNFRLNLY